MKKIEERGENIRFESSVILIVKCFAVCKPESKPADTLPLAAKYVQGAAKEDWVTECETAELLVKLFIQRTLYGWIFFRNRD